MKNLNLPQELNPFKFILNTGMSILGLLGPEGMVVSTLFQSISSQLNDYSEQQAEESFQFNKKLSEMQKKIELMELSLSIMNKIFKDKI